MAPSQGDSYSALAIYLGRGGPVDFVGADHAAAAAGQFIADATVLIGVVAHLQNHAGLQYKHWNPRRGRSSSAHRILGNVAGVGDLRNLLGRRLLAGGNADAAHGQLRIPVISLAGARAL